jgi:hypothetical protein
VNNYQVTIYNPFGAVFLLQTFQGNSVFDAVAACLAYLVSIAADPTFGSEIDVRLIT